MQIPQEIHLNERAVSAVFIILVYAAWRSGGGVIGLIKYYDNIDVRQSITNLASAKVFPHHASLSLAGDSFLYFGWNLFNYWRRGKKDDRFRECGSRFNTHGEYATDLS